MKGWLKLNKKNKLLFHLNLQVRMKEVMSAVWLQGLDLSYLREQVNSLNTSCYWQAEGDRVWM